MTTHESEKRDKRYIQHPTKQKSRRVVTQTTRPVRVIDEQARPLPCTFYLLLPNTPTQTYLKPLQSSTKTYVILLSVSRPYSGIPYPPRTSGNRSESPSVRSDIYKNACLSSHPHDPSIIRTTTNLQIEKKTSRPDVKNDGSTATRPA